MTVFLRFEPARAHFLRRAIREPQERQGGFEPYQSRAANGVSEHV